MNQKLYFILLLVFFSLISNIYAQDAVGIGTNLPNNSSMLDLSSTSQGLLPPRLTYTERNNMTSPASGLIIWCSDCGVRGEMQVFDGIQWKKISASSASLPSPPTTGRPDNNTTGNFPQSVKISD
jgi:hypothetical protein